MPIPVPVPTIQPLLVPSASTQPGASATPGATPSETPSKGGAASSGSVGGVVAGAALGPGVVSSGTDRVKIEPSENESSSSSGTPAATPSAAGGAQESATSSPAPGQEISWEGAQPPWPPQLQMQQMQMEYMRVLQENQLLRQYLQQCQTLVAVQNQQYRLLLASQAQGGLPPTNRSSADSLADSPAETTAFAPQGGPAVATAAGGNP